MSHLSAVHLRLCLGALPLPVREVVRHLLDCPQCAAAARPALGKDGADREPPAPGIASPAEDPAYDAVFDRVQRQLAAAQAVHAVHRRRARALVAELLAEPPAAWPGRLETRPELATVEVAGVLLDRSRASLPDDPACAAARAQLALAVLDRVDASAPAAAVLPRLRVRTWALLGQALALQGDGPGADAVFAGAGRLGARLLGAEEEAELLERHALALWHQGRAPQALAHLARAADVAVAIGELPRAVRIQARLAQFHLDLADLERAAQHFAWSLLHAEEIGDEEAVSFLRHRLAWVLLADDQVEAAGAILADARPRLSGEFVKLVLLIQGPFSQPGDRLAAFQRELAAAHERGQAFQAGVYALLVARELVRAARAHELPSLAPYLLGAAGSPELAPGSRDALRRLARAAGEGAVSLPLIIETAQAIRYDRDPAPAGEPFCF